MSPQVSFVVPCFKLGHFLEQCVDSILAQTYTDLEVIIMDDCSPDDTPQVACSYADPRVRYVRNDPNLGHLKNYNAGINLARGNYVWLISADDYLRSSHILERYVRCFELNPRVGFVFCPGVQVRDGRETAEIDYSFYSRHDEIVNGRKFLATLLQFNTVLAASGCVRRECYEKVGLFPLDMPWMGDWYLWASVAFLYDVGYLAEPMVCYRAHDLSMTMKLHKEELARCSAESLALPWLFKRKAEDLDDVRLVRDSLTAVARHYAWRLAQKRPDAYPVSMTTDEFEESLRTHTSSEAEQRAVRARLCEFIADEYYRNGEIASARRLYMAALAKEAWRARLWAKLILVLSGRAGHAVRCAWRSRHVKRLPT